MSEEESIPLCNASDLVEGGRAVPFDVIYGGETCRAFAVRFEGQGRTLPQNMIQTR